MIGGDLEGDRLGLEEGSMAGVPWGGGSEHGPRLEHACKGQRAEGPERGPPWT